MPLSKARDKKRKQLARLERLINNPSVQPKPSDIPLYDATKHKAGDRVRMYQGKRTIVTVIPHLDGDGHPIYGEG